MRLVYFGSGSFGVPSLRQLLEAHQVQLVVTQPDRPAGRNRTLTPTAIAEIAAEHGVPILKPERVNAPECIDRIRGVNADAFVVIAFGQKLGRPLLDGIFAMNLHASLLPKYRGAAPINWAMIHGESETGLSVITLADRMDAGDVLGQTSTAIDPQETAGELHDRLSEMGPPLVLSVLEAFERGTLQRDQQHDAQATPAPKFSKSDGTVSFDQPALRVRQRVHGLTPWPGCTVMLEGRPLRLARVQVNDPRMEYVVPGMVLSDGSIACRVGSIRLLEVQSPGGRVMSFDDYRRGQPVREGMLVTST